MKKDFQVRWPNRGSVSVEKGRLEKFNPRGWKNPLVVVIVEGYKHWVACHLHSGLPLANGKLQRDLFRKVMDQSAGREAELRKVFADFIAENGGPLNANI